MPPEIDLFGSFLSLLRRLGLHRREVEVCPEDIHITDNAIIPLKERVADEFYDPFRWIFRKLSGK